jgi:3-hydroxyacyl-[acyl-carrier-protein] dehydratase
MIKNLKFVKPISPIDDEEVEVVFQKVEYVDDEIRVKGIIQHEQDVYTKFSLRFDKA